MRSLSIILCIKGNSCFFLFRYQPPNNSGAFWRANTKTVNSKKDKPNITKCARNQFKKQGRNKSNN